MSTIYFLIIFILIQLIGEVLPISSSSHTAIFEYILQLRGNQFLDAQLCDVLEHFLLGPTLLVVAFFFFNRWKCFLDAANPFSGMNYRYRITLFFIALKIGAFLTIATGITFIFYLFFRTTLLQRSIIELMNIRFWGLVCTTLLLFSSSFIKQQNRSFNILSAFLMGIVQGLCLLPGLSRFAFTYIAGFFFGLSRRRSFEISWLLYSMLAFPSFFKGLIGLEKYKGLSLLFDLRISGALVGGAVLSFFLFSGIKKLIDFSYLWIVGFYMFIPMIYTFLICH